MTDWKQCKRLVVNTYQFNKKVILIYRYFGGAGETSGRNGRFKPAIEAQTAHTKGSHLKKSGVNPYFFKISRWFASLQKHLLPPKTLWSQLT